MTCHTQILDRFLAALYKNDRETMATMIAPEFAARVPAALSYGGRYDGADGFFRLLENFAAAFEIHSAEQTSRFVSSAGDRFVLEFHLAGRAVGSGLEFRSTLLELWVFRDGLLHEVAPHWFDVPDTGVRATTI